MDKLPAELITLIASFLERIDYQANIVWLLTRIKPVYRLPPFATISRRWQLAIEARTFRSIQLKSPELSYFAQILTGHRKRLLSELAYDVILPTYDDNACAKFETEKDQERNNQAFTYAVHALYQFIKSLERSGARMESRALTLNINDFYAPMDGAHRDKIEEHKQQCAFGKRHDLWDHRYEHSILRLLEHPELPSLLSPSSFIMSGSICSERKSDPPTQEFRGSYLAMALPTISSPSLRKFALSFYQVDPQNQYSSPPSALLPTEPSTDHLSRALYALSQSPTLNSFILNHIVISPELYWPANSPSTPPAWPNIHHHHVGFDLSTSDGEWYFMRDPSKPIGDDEGDTDSDSSENEGDDTVADSASEDEFYSRADTYNEHRELRAVGHYPYRDFRTVPSDNHITPLLLAMARAAAQMPNLQSMSLTTSHRHDVHFEIFFNAAGCVNRNWWEVDGETAETRLKWKGGYELA
ncbi:MAG: hypothetical protein Q9202_004061 [Teloschistes flavicans]